MYINRGSLLRFKILPTKVNVIIIELTRSHMYFIIYNICNTIGGSICPWYIHFRCIHFIGANCYPGITEFASVILPWMEIDGM